MVVRLESNLGMLEMRLVGVAGVAVAAVLSDAVVVFVAAVTVMTMATVMLTLPVKVFCPVVCLVMFQLCAKGLFLPAACHVCLTVLFYVLLLSQTVCV